jgi:hypothetical protein
MSSNPDGVADSQVGEVVETPIIQLPDKTRFFEAGGCKYQVEEEITVGRYKHYQQMEVQLGFTVSFSSLVDMMKGAYSALNERRDADAAVLIKQMLEGATLIVEKKPIALYVATLFINRPDENRAEWSQALAEEKIKHWENIDANFFLGSALAWVRRFPEKYKEIAQMLQKVSQVKSQMESYE